MADAKVLLQIDGPIATVQLHNPERYNALSRQVVVDLGHVAAQLAVARDVRAVIIDGGESKAFCAGADLKERQSLDEAQVYEMVHLLRESVNLVSKLPMPIIAAIRGMAFGGGCELALACDLRVMADDAQIGLTEVSLGIIPAAGGCTRLPHIVGVAKAKEMIYTAQRLTAQEALASGLVNRVVPAERLLETARELAERIAAQGPLAVRAAKRAINAGLPVAAGLAAEFEAYEAIIPTGDRLEGLKAFAEKRAPVYTGR